MMTWNKHYHVLLSNMPSVLKHDINKLQWSALVIPSVLEINKGLFTMTKNIPLEEAVGAVIWKSKNKKNKPHTVYTIYIH